MLTTALTLALLLPTWKPTGFAWNPGQFPIPYCVITRVTHQSGLNATVVNNAIDRSVNYWRSSGVGGGTSCTTYDAARATYTCSAVIDLSDNKNNIYFEGSRWSFGSATLGVTHSGGFGNCGSVTDNTGARTSLTCQGDPDIELNDVNIQDPWDDTGNGTDISSIVTHEYGHFLGLDHCNDNNTCQFGTAVMYAAYGGGQFRVPRSDDVTGVCALYPGQAGGVGFPCTTNNTCTSHQCVNPSSGGYCTAACGTCPTGYTCGASTQFPGGNVCVRDDGTNKALCEVCNGAVPNACANNGVCVGGLPEPMGGRCTIPCPNPAIADGGCPNLYTCVQIQNAGAQCIPKSSDCTNLNNFTMLGMGQACGSGTTGSCSAGLECIQICTQSCTGPGGQGSCPTGFACDTFNFQTGPADYCAPPVREGANCSGFVACTTGPCLSTGGANPTCYQDCANNPNACNNAQMCNTYNLQGGGSVSICEPPGVPPRPDAGVPPDTGVVGPNDTGVMPGDDSGTVNPGPDAGQQQQADAGMTMNQPDAGSQQMGTCACDQYYYCEDNCDCDQECPCTCDTTFQCDDGCSCDPECYSTNGNGGQTPVKKVGACGCDTTREGGSPAGLVAAALGLSVLSLARRRRLM
ncbi:MAG: matrixin family metalloprotease [Myxococcota bacterium]